MKYYTASKYFRCILIHLKTKKKIIREKQKNGSNLMTNYRYTNIYCIYIFIEKQKKNRSNIDLYVL